MQISTMPSLFSLTSRVVSKPSVALRAYFSFSRISVTPLVNNLVGSGYGLEKSVYIFCDGGDYYVRCVVGFVVLAFYHTEDRYLGVASTVKGAVKRLGNSC